METNIIILLEYRSLIIDENRIGGAKELSKGHWKRITTFYICKNEVMEGGIDCVWAKCIS